MTERRELDVIGFDADDTLWQSEDAFHAAEQRFVELVAAHTPAGIDVLAALRATERTNLSITGYGVKAFALSMVQAAVTITDGAVPARVIGELVDLAHDMLTEPVHLLPDVPEVLDRLAPDYRLVLITKGDLVHQLRKVSTSGLEHHFDHVEVVLEKDPTTYAKVLRHLDIDAEGFCMVGNSVRSDVLPVLELGGHAVHVPYHLTWELEQSEDHGLELVVLDSLRELPDWIASGRPRGHHGGP